MHYYIYATKDAWISSGSSHIDGTSYRDQNFGQDEILELKKVYWNQSFDYQTRILVSFSGTEFTNVSQSIVNGNITDPKYFLRLYEAAGNQELSTEYVIGAYPLSESWDQGTGKFKDDPKVTNGVSWKNRNYYPGNSAVTMSRYGGYYYSGSGYQASQSFSYESPDINMDVTDIVNKWLGGSSNYGLLLKFSGSQESATGTDGTITYGQLKFFSSQTNTIYQPKLEVRWDDHKPCTGSNTGSLTELTMSGAVENTLFMKGLRESYREAEKVKFRVMPRARYIPKSFSTSAQTVTGSYIPEGSGSYSIIDMATNETIIPFSAYTSMSCDTTSNYFIQWMNGFQPYRAYKIIYKIKYNDGQEVIHDNDFEFVVRS
jgi:hypothetical protein